MKDLFDLQTIHPDSKKLAKSIKFVYSFVAFLFLCRNLHLTSFEQKTKKKLVLIKNYNSVDCLLLAFDHVFYISNRKYFNHLLYFFIYDRFE